MADENSTSPITEVAATDAAVKVPAPKKPRAPRRRKAAVEETVVASPAKAEKLPRGRKKRGEQAVDVKPAPAKVEAAGKGTKKSAAVKKTPKQAAQTAKAPVSAADEVADLIQLEQENKRLRKTLADKLRAENADLRKRLGLD
ncbi:MAG: SyrB-like regulator [Rhizobium sp.]